MHKGYVFLFFLLLINAPFYPQAGRYQLLDQFCVKQKTLGSNVPVTLKMYDIAIDQRRGLAYVAGIVTRTTSIINIATGQETGAVATGHQAGQLIHLGVVPGSGYLLQAYTEARPVSIDLLNPQTSQVAGTYTFSSVTSAMAGLTVDAATNRIFVGDSTFIRVLDAGTMALLTSINNGTTASEPQIDTVNHRLYVAARNPLNGNVGIKVYDAAAPYTLLRTITVASTLPLGRIFFDLPNNRLVCAAFNTVTVVDITTGSVLRTITVAGSMNDQEFLPAQQKVIGVVPDAYTANGLHGSWCKFYIINTSTGQVDSMMMGDKSSRLDYFAAGNKLVFPEMHSGYVSIFDPDTQRRDSVDIGESADYFSFSPDNRDVFITKRLGGSNVLRYNKAAKQVTAFKAGAWPSTCETDSALNKLFVVNHFESSVSVFNAATGTLLATLPLQAGEGRTDAIASSYLDTRLHKLFVCMPEFRKLFVVDCNTYAVTQTTVPGFDYQSSDKGIGVLQAISDPRTGRVFVLSTRSKKIKVFNSSSNTWVDSIAFGPLWNTSLAAMQANCLLLDTASNTLFAGNIPVDLSTLRPGAAITGPGALLGFNTPRTLLYGISSENDTLYVYELHPSTYVVQAKTPLYKASDFYTAVYRYDPLANELWTAEFNTALVRRYKLETSTTIAIGTEPGEAELFSIAQNYPNPFNPATTITVYSSGLTEQINIHVVDVTGKLAAVLFSGRLPKGNHPFVFNADGLPSGIYFATLRSANRYSAIKMVLVR